MKTHNLKIWPEFFKAVEAGTKTYEVRKDDRGFCFGDEVILQEWDGTRDYNDDLITLKPPRGHTGRELKFKIGYIFELEGGNEDMVVFSLLKF